MFPTTKAQSIAASADPYGAALDAVGYYGIAEHSLDGALESFRFHDNSSMLFYDGKLYSIGCQWSLHNGVWKAP